MSLIGSVSSQNEWFAMLSEQHQLADCVGLVTIYRWCLPLFSDQRPVMLADCDFEAGTCGWSQVSNDDFDWTVGSGRTPNSGTGPSSDHTLRQTSCKLYF